MDWRSVIATKQVWMNKHCERGRNGRRIDKVVIHHNAGVNQTTEDVWRTWQTRVASAHYQVERDGTIGQLVRDIDTAYHCGGGQNTSSIGIEHANVGGAAAGWPISSATLEAGAHLVAALCLRYGLGRPTWQRNVFGHLDFWPTACPGLLYTAYREAYVRRAGQWYDAMLAGNFGDRLESGPDDGVDKDDRKVIDVRMLRLPDGRVYLDNGVGVQHLDYGHYQAETAAGTPEVMVSEVVLIRLMETRNQMAHELAKTQAAYAAAEAAQAASDGK